MAIPVSDTKHFRISKLLGEQFSHLPPGAQVPTVDELKRMFQASQATIGRALERLRQQGLIERMPGKLRFVKPSIGEGARFLIAVIRPLWCSQDYDALINRIYATGQREHFGFQVIIYQHFEELNLEHVFAIADAALFLAPPSMNAEQIAAIDGARKPLILLQAPPSQTGAGLVCLDERRAGGLAASHLLGLGHRSLLGLLSEPPTAGSTRRLQGWQATVRNGPWRGAKATICDCSDHGGREAISEVYERLHEWMKLVKSPFTAIYCTSTSGAWAVLRVLRERGVKVPEEVSVITHAVDPTICDFVHPAVTSVEADLAACAASVIGMLRQKLEGKGRLRSGSSRILLKPLLVQRESCGRVRVD